MPRFFLPEWSSDLLNFYPNVYKDEIKDIIGNVKTGDIVDVITNDMKFFVPFPFL